MNMNYHAMFPGSVGHVNGLGPPNNHNHNQPLHLPQIPDTSNMAYGGIPYPPVVSSYP